MWRFISRGVKDIKYSPSKPVDSKDNVHKPSSLLKKKNCFIFDNIKSWNPSCFQWTKGTFKSDKNKQNQNDTNIQYQHSLFEAFGWSGVIVFGWYVGQSIRNHCYYFNHKDKDVRRPPDCQYKSLSELVTKVVFAQPQYKSVLPLGSARSDNNKSVQAYDNYGPVTKEDNFNQAANEFYDVHKEMIAELENVRGLKFLKKKKLNDAIVHFKQAVLLNHSSAAFNLAQCYENGWGTEKDLSQAVYYYELAQKQGYAPAIYNLGIYYSKGLGGLAIDGDKANELFLVAAKLGHAQAAQKTGLVKCPAPSLEDLSKMFEEQNSKSPYPVQIIEAVESYMKSNDITPDEAYHSGTDGQDSPLWDSFIQEVSDYKQMSHGDRTESKSYDNTQFVF